MYLTWTQLQQNMFCLLGGVVFFIFFYQRDMLNGCFASSICLLQDHCNLLMWKKISRAHGLMPAFFWRRAALWQTHSLWLLSGTPFLACTLSVLLTPGHWGKLGRLASPLLCCSVIQLHAGDGRMHETGRMLCCFGLVLDLRKREKYRARSYL